MAAPLLDELLQEEERCVALFERTGDASPLDAVRSRLLSRLQTEPDCAREMRASCAERARRAAGDKRARARAIAELEVADRAPSAKLARLLSALEREEEGGEEDASDLEDIDAWDASESLLPALRSARPVGPACALKEHQREGVDFTLSRLSADRGAILAFAMGLGKTLTALVAVDRLAATWAGGAAFRCVVLCPSSVVSNWKAEHAKFVAAGFLSLPCLDPVFSAVDFYAACDEWVASGGMLVLSYDLLCAVAASKRHPDRRRALLGAHALVVDELHAIKNLKTDRARRIDAFSTRKRLGLTGTPLSNSPSDFYSIIRLMDERGIDLSPSEFKRLFDTPITRAQFYDAPEDVRRRGREQTAVLRSLIQDVALHKSAVLLERMLPPKRECVAVYRCTEEEVARLAAQVDTKAHYLAAQAVTDATVRSTKVRVAKAALDVMGEGEAAVVFCEHPATLLALEGRLGGRGRVVQGCTGASARQATIDSFAAGDFDVLLLSTGACSTGINCQRASLVVLMEPSENPTRDAQAVCRAWRMGQEKEVTVLRMAAEGTVDVRILRRGIVKSNMAHSVLHAEHVASGLTRADAHADDVSSVSLRPVAACPVPGLAGREDLLCGWTDFDSFSGEREEDGVDASEAKNKFHREKNRCGRAHPLAGGGTVLVPEGEAFVVLEGGRREAVAPPVPVFEVRADRTVLTLCPELKEGVSYQVAFASAEEGGAAAEWDPPSAPFRSKRVTKKKGDSEGRRALVCRSRAILDGAHGPWSPPSAPFCLRGA